MKPTDIANELRKLADKYEQAHIAPVPRLENCSLQEAATILDSALGQGRGFSIALDLDFAVRNSPKTRWMVWDGNTHYRGRTLAEAVNLTVEANNPPPPPTIDSVQTLLDSVPAAEPQLLEI